MKNKKRTLFHLLIFMIILGVSYSLLSFCILTNNAGDFRKYYENVNGTQYLPFIYRLHNSTPENYFTPVWNGANTWNDVVSSYFEFQEGPTTSNNHLSQNGINLIYFDFAGDNFDPGTNVIAFSMTYTNYTGGFFHAVESDLIWNARDYPPSPYDYPTNQYDLQSVITHELGHHLGLGHQGSPGSPPGCGELIEQATMYGYASLYDTTKRSLHLHDRAGVSTIYPTWVLAGSVTDSATGNPIGGAYIILNQGRVTAVGPPEYHNTWECPGYVVTDTIWVNSDGLFQNTSLDQNLSLVCKAFGYQSASATVQFDQPGGIEETDTIYVDFVLPQQPGVSVQGTLQDQESGAGIAASLEFFGLNNPGNFPIATTETDENGNFSLSIPAGPYRIEINCESPYPPYQLTTEIGTEGATLNIQLLPAQILLYDDDNGENRESTYIELLDSLEITYHHWDAFNLAATPTFQQVKQFPEPLTVIWFTSLSENPLSQEELLLIDSLLINDGRLFINGNNIASSLSTNPLLSDLFHTQFLQKISNQLFQSVTGDPVGMDKYLSVGTLDADKDMINTDGSPLAWPVFKVLGQDGFGMIRSESNYHLVFGSFIFEDITEGQSVFITRYELLQNIINWFNDSNHPPSPIVLQQPDSILQLDWNAEPDTVFFLWNSSLDPDDDSLTYYLFLNTDSSFNAPYMDLIPVSDTSLYYYFNLSCEEWGELAQDSTLSLFWGVYCSDGKGVGLSTSLRRITFRNSWQNLPPSTVNLLWPLNTDTIHASVLDSSIIVNFRWNRAVDPNCGDSVSYFFTIRNIDNEDIIFSDYTSDTSYTFNLRSIIPTRDDTLHYYTHYEWSVSAFDGELNSDTSLAEFTLEEIYINLNDPPSLSSILFPANGDTFTIRQDTTIQLLWKTGTDPDPEDTLTYYLTLTMGNELLLDTSTVDTTMSTEIRIENLIENVIYEANWLLFCSDGEYNSDTLQISFYLVRKPLSIHQEPLPQAFTLYTAYPNPFNPTTTLKFTIPEKGEVTIQIFNLQGQRVRRLISRVLPAGLYQLTWDGRDQYYNLLPSGIYIVQVRWNETVKQQKLLLVK